MEEKGDRGKRRGEGGRGRGERVTGERGKEEVYLSLAGEE